MERPHSRPCCGRGRRPRGRFYAQDFSTFDISRITAVGGLSTNGLGVPHAGAGTVYVRDTDEPRGQLIIDAGDEADGITPLGLPVTDNFVIPDDVLIRGVNTHARSDHAGMTITIGGSLRLENSPQVTVTEGTLDVANGVMVTTGVATVSGRVQAGSLSVINGGVLMTSVAMDAEIHKLEVAVSGTVLVDSTSKIDVSGRGYLKGRTTGNTSDEGATGYAGGSYGGLGGVGSAYPHAVGSPNRGYGDYLSGSPMFATSIAALTKDPRPPRPLFFTSPFFLFAFSSNDPIT